MRWEAKNLTAILAFGNAVTFLELNMMMDQTIKFFEYFKFDADTDLKSNPFMIMDSQAIENLEIAECIVNGSPTVEGSLLQWVDHTKTLFCKTRPAASTVHTLLRQHEQHFIAARWLKHCYLKRGQTVGIGWVPANSQTFLMKEGYWRCL